MTDLRERRRASFGRDAPAYDRARPGYPDAVFAELGRAARVLEVGAGTGKATVSLARRCGPVLALEPDPGMAAVLRGHVAGLDVEVVEARFEAWTPPSRFQLVVSAQAWHWIDEAVRVARAAAALAPGGLLAIVRNEKDPIEPSLRAALDDAYARWMPEAVPAPAEDRFTAELVASDDFVDVEVVRHPWRATYETGEYLALLATYSDHAVMEEERRAGLFGEIAAAIDGRGGCVEIPYVTVTTRARRR
jgi:trans-aconitate methyltransferase